MNMSSLVLVYYILKIESHLLVPEAVLKAENWTEEDQAWVFRQDIIKGLDLRIVKKMSNQLWYKISMEYKPLELLKKINIKKDEVASKLTNILKDLDQ